MREAVVLIARIIVRVANLLVFRGIIEPALSLTAKLLTLRGIVKRTCTLIANLLAFRGILKRTLTLIAVLAICIVGFLSIRGSMPFMAVFGISMEPELHAGDLLLIEEISPSDIEVGDIIVFTVPQAVREYYNYPQIIAHRVIAVRDSEAGLAFRTKGDNTGEDPFTVRPQDISGQVGKQIPYLGFPLLFFQSQQGVIFIIVALLLFAIYLYSDEISRGRQIVHKSIFAPVIRENQNTNRALEKRMETTEKGIVGTQQALNSFASAIAEYAEHLKSHTSAIQGLSEASQELKKGAAEQNRVLTRLVETMEEMSSKPKTEEPILEKEEREPEIEAQFPPGCVRSRRRLTEDESIFKAG